MSIVARYDRKRLLIEFNVLEVSGMVEHTMPDFVALRLRHRVEGNRIQNIAKLLVNTEKNQFVCNFLLF